MDVLAAGAVVAAHNYPRQTTAFLAAGSIALIVQDEVMRRLMSHVEYVGTSAIIHFGIPTAFVTTKVASYFGQPAACGAAVGAVLGGSPVAFLTAFSEGGMFSNPGGFSSYLNLTTYSVLAPLIGSVAAIASKFIKVF